MYFAPTVAFLCDDDSGAVTVDWVVLTAALVGLGMAMTDVIGDGMQNLSANIRAQLETDHIRTGF